MRCAIYGVFCCYCCCPQGLQRWSSATGTRASCLPRLQVHLLLIPVSEPRQLTETTIECSKNSRRPVQPQHRWLLRTLEPPKLRDAATRRWRRRNKSKSTQREEVSVYRCADDQVELIECGVDLSDDLFPVSVDVFTEQRKVCTFCPAPLGHELEAVFFERKPRLERSPCSIFIRTTFTFENTRL